MMKVFRIVLFNCLVLVALLFVLNLLSAAILDHRAAQKLSIQDGSDDGRATSPAYTDIRSAKQIYHDFYLTETAYYSYEDIRLEPFSSKTANIDKEGMRRTVGQPSRPKGYIRFFGGSTMWGTGTDDKGTIPSLVQKDFPEYKVINYGQSGHASGQNLVALLKLIRSGEEIGTVVFYDGVNEIFHQCTGQKDIEDTGYTPLIRDLLRFRKERATTAYFFNATVGSLIKLAFDQEIKTTTDVSDIPASACSKDPQRVDEIARRLILNWAMARQLVESNGGKFVAVLQPVSSVGEPKRDYLPETREWDKWYKKGYAKIRQDMKRLNYAYDLSDSLDGKGPVYVDWCHVTSTGNAIVADRISTLLRQTLHSP